MKYLFGIAWRMARRTLRTTLLINIQFVFIFLFLMILIGMMGKHHNDLNRLDNVVGSDTWLIQPTTSTNNNIEASNWNDAQLKWLDQQFPGKVGLLGADYSQYSKGKITYTANSVLWKLLRENNGSDELYKKTGISEDIIRVINPPNWNNIAEPVFREGTVTERDQLTAYIFDVSDDKINFNTLSDELSEMANGQNYRVARLIGSERQSVVIESIYTNIILVFVTLSSLLILTSVMSFTLVRFLSQSRNLRLLYLYGATRVDLAAIVLFSNLLLVGPAFIIASCIVVLMYTVLPIVIGFSLIIGLLIFVMILFFLTVPVIRTNSSNLKINEI